MNMSKIPDVDTNEDNSNGAFRVRNVTEINSEYTSPIKRKLPTWLNSPQGSSDKKRQRTDEVTSCTPNMSTFNLLAENLENKIVDKSNKVSENTDRSNKSIEIPTTTNEDTTERILSQIPEETGNNALPSTNTNKSKETTEPNQLSENTDRTNKSTEISTTTNKDTIETISSQIPEETGNNVLPSTNTNEDEETTESNSILELPLAIKLEIKEETVVTVSSTAECFTSKTIPDIKQTVKEEPSSTTRESCKYGIRCYRRNPQHRLEESHPGDSDYRRPNYPEPPKGTPDCPFGDLCYRRNPSHFKDFSHPPSTDFKKNWQNHQKRLRDRKQKKNYADDSDLDENEYDLADDFIDDGSDDEFIPTDDDSDEDLD